jgi:hypothetical protein
MELVALCGFYDMGKEAEVVSKGKQSIFMNLNFALIVQIAKDPSVFS